MFEQNSAFTNAGPTRILELSTLLAGGVFFLKLCPKLSLNPKPLTPIEIFAALLGPSGGLESKTSAAWGSTFHGPCLPEMLYRFPLRPIGTQVAPTVPAASRHV